MRTDLVERLATAVEQLRYKDGPLMVAARDLLAEARRAVIVLSEENAMLKSELQDAHELYEANHG